MNKTAIFFGTIVLAIVFVVIGVYYLIPGYPHFLVTHDTNASHLKHAVAFFALAVISVLIALVTRPKAAIK